jgi:hypothetical protein
MTTRHGAVAREDDLGKDGGLTLGQLTDPEGRVIGLIQA